MQKYTLEEMDELITDFLVDEKFDFQMIGNHDNETHFIIEGYTYTINVYLNSNCTITAWTTHKERYKQYQYNEIVNGYAEDNSEGNKKEIKKLSTMESYVLNFIDK